eukprot:gb/GEZN01005990.1/.p1 GENE.gb/GEZN01005990.1/~~gb/GEZN01005990.1/.p1  ORF type:complete len:504 (-),score=59.75 gb/GEZN01005990.1/:160-1671(-)
MAFLLFVSCLLSGLLASSSDSPKDSSVWGVRGLIVPHQPVWNKTHSELEAWFVQPLDHFNAQNTQTWKQRYFTNSSFFTGKGPVFLCVGGETYLDEDVVVSGENHCGDAVSMAPSYGALILALEHRYYGASVPTEDFSTPNMAYLSSQQALADLAAFIGHINQVYQLTAVNKWVTFGGSYPGMLAAWARLEFPHLIHGAIASSAPVRAVTNFQGYNRVMAESMGSLSVGGSPACVDMIEAACSAVGQQLQTKTGRRELESQFNLCGEDVLESELNQRQFTIGLGELFPVQSNDPACNTTACNISGCCRVMLDESAPDSAIVRLATLSKLLHGKKCVNVAYDSLAQMLTSTSLVQGRGRVWFYQTCTEFGFYQTCDPNSGCIFTSEPWLNTLENYYELCRLAFGLSSDSIEQAVVTTNLRYGGNHTSSSRVYFVNGQIDPWHAASVLHDLSYDQQVHWVLGSSHHFWTHSPKPTDLPPIMEARKLINLKIFGWLFTVQKKLQVF